MLIIIILLSLLPIKSPQIILEYKKEIKDLKTPEEILLNLVETEYYINIEIGTPKQKLKANIEFTKFIFYISGDKNYKKYNPKISNTYKANSTKEEIIDCDLFYNGFFSNETIYLNNIKYDNFSFILSGNSTNFYKMFSCSIGLGIPAFYLKRNVINFIEILFLKKEIKSYSFFINQKNENEGQIIIGKFPHEFYLEKYKFKKYESSYIEITSYYNFWNCQFDFINFDNKTFYNNHMVLFDFNLEGLILGKTFFDYVKDNFFRNYINEKICFDKNYSNYIFIYCEKNKNINFENFSDIIFYNRDFNYTFYFNYTELFKEKGNYIFFLIFSNIEYYSMVGLGRIFLNKYQLGFNYDRRIILFYKDNLEKIINHRFNYLIIIIFILFIILCFCLYYYLKIFKKKKKVYATELDDDIKLSEKII